MAQKGIEPEKITKPIQLVAAWFAALVLLVTAFIGAANTVQDPSWLPVLFGVAAVLIVPMFARLVYLLQTTHRTELLEDVYYSKVVADAAAQVNFRPENVLGPKAGTVTESPSAEGTDLAAIRDGIFERNRGLFLVHTWRPSKVEGQIADITIRVHEHRTGPMLVSNGKVDRVEYYIGDYFFNGKSVLKTNAADNFRLDISSYGTTDCVARVYLNDDTPPIILDRYLDFVA